MGIQLHFRSLAPSGILLDLVGHVILFWMLMSTCLTQEVRRASQCFKSRGIPEVRFECAPNEMIRIIRAFHGIASAERGVTAALVPGQEPQACVATPTQPFPNCTYCEGDCIDDSMNLVYDWSTCMGNTTCTRTVMQSYLPGCQWPKFSDYLEVEYQCVAHAEVINICSNTDRWVTSGYITSPGYPAHYPVGQDCICKLETDWNSKILLSFYDLLLETKEGRCRADWLMIRQRAQKHRHCGAIMTGTKNLTTENNLVALQFHSDDFDNVSQSFQYFTRKLKGFWLYFETETRINVACRRLGPEDEEVREIYADDADYSEIVTRDNLTLTTPGENQTEADEGGSTGGGVSTLPGTQGPNDSQDGAKTSGTSFMTSQLSVQTLAPLVFVLFCLNV